MVIDIIDVQRVAVFKTENHPPVGPHSYRPEPSPVPFEGMQPKTGHAHIGNAARRVKPDPNISEFHNMLGSRPARIIVCVKAS